VTRMATVIPVATLLLVGGGCNSQQQGSALRALADSVMAGKPHPECHEERGFPGPGEPPFRECRVSAADTNVIVTKDARGHVVMVSRQWTAAPGRDARLIALDSLLRARLGNGEPTCQDPTLVGRTWRGSDHHIILGRLPSDEVYFASIAGSPLCK
jgi:hypothetical protein